MSGVNLIALLGLCALYLVACEISCRNEAGEPVDWFVVYKLPKYRINDTGTGLEYLYLDSRSQGWQVSKFLTNMTQSALGQVLQQLYQSYEDNSTAYMLYNDAPPIKNNFSTKYGHTKGALFFDQQQGFWLIHSVPHFPPFLKDGFGYPDTGKLYGQTAICVTYKYFQFKQIAAQLLYYNPNVYNCSIPDLYHEDLWGLSTICQGKRFPWVNDTSIAVLKSAGGELFLNFAKSKYFVDDIFTAWMAQILKTDLLTETWHPKEKELPSNCSLPWHVYNIQRIALPNLSFYSHYDHSKWCIARYTSDSWICIGDLNRQPGQIWRSGGFICTQKELIYEAFKKMVAHFSDCKSNEH
ncbi:PREDICTED: deoxyribonuclease-2-beta [Nanorana parkeri]|uniref:deoxyribonuclease-2-beta n=1 Tax=Nanorana parkeri TaxID=125878 RepID=UPI0008549DD6|nr:PREDICTED: deoxyribonuclease-2-beta [Nanorana parkeri]